MKTLNLQLFANLKLPGVFVDADGNISLPGTNKNNGSNKESGSNKNSGSTYTGNSIVDYYKSMGWDSSFDNRAKDALKHGISNYTGTAEQNLQLLGIVRDGKTTTTDNGKKEDSAKNGNANLGTTGDYGEQTPAQTNTANTPYQTGQMPTYTNSQFQTSAAYNQAMQYTNSLLEKLNSGKTTYTDQISQLIKDYQSREEFSYDASTDTLFQQMLASSMNSGRTAMADAMGQAAALTGGYGSTYSQAVGNNVFNQYVQEAYDNLPQYYQMAFDRYNQEGQDMLTELSMLSDADAREYDRLYNAYNANFNNAQNMYNQEYSEWRDSEDFAFKQYQTEWEQEWMKTEAEKEDAKWLALNDLNGDGKVDSKDHAYGSTYTVDENGNEVPKYDDLSTSEYDKAMRIWEENGGGETGLNAVASYFGAIGKNVSNDTLASMFDGKTVNEEYDSPEGDILEGAIKALAEGGEAGLEEYCMRYPSYNFDEIVGHAMKYGEVSNPSKKTYTRVDAMMYVDQYGNPYHIKDLPKDIQSKLEQMEVGKTYNFSTKKYAEEEEPKAPLIANSLNGVMGHRVGSGGRIGVTNVLKD